MKKTSVFAAILLASLLRPSFGQTLQEAQDQAAIEKSKAEAAASRAAAKKSELDLQNANDLAKLEVQAAQDKSDEAKRKSLTESIAAVNNLKADSKDVSVTGSPIETKALANRAVTKVAEQIVDAMPPEVCRANSTVVLADGEAIDALPAYEVGVMTVKSLLSSYTALVNNARKGFNDLKQSLERRDKSAALAIPALLQGFAAIGSIAQTFRTQLTVSSTEVSIDQLAINGAMAGIWRSKCGSSVLTSFPNLGKDFASSEAAKQLNALSDQLASAQDLETEMTLWLIPNKVASTNELEALETARKAAAASSKKRAPTAQQIADAEVRKTTVTEVESVLAKLKAADLRIDQAIQQLVATSEKQPVSPIAQLAKVERFATAVKSANAYILTIKAVGGGGNTVTTNNFWRGAKVFHSGGAVIAYTLLKGTDGAYVAGGVLDSHQGYIQLDIADKKSLGNSWDVDMNTGKR